MLSPSSCPVTRPASLIATARARRLPSTGCVVVPSKKRPNSPSGVAEVQAAWPWLFRPKRPAWPAGSSTSAVKRVAGTEAGGAGVGAGGLADGAGGVADGIGAPAGGAGGSDAAGGEGIGAALGAEGAVDGTATGADGPAASGVPRSALPDPPPPHPARVAASTRSATWMGTARDGRG